MSILRPAICIIVIAASLTCQQTLIAQESTPTATVVEHIAPDKLKTYDFKIKDFAFVRLRYSARALKSEGRWATDYPDADIFFSNRLLDETNLKVASLTLVLTIDDPSLRAHPFAYVSSNEGFHLNDDEAAALHKYVTEGGFVLIDDSWGDNELRQVADELKKAFPDKVLVELAPQHDIFHCVYDFTTPPQVFSIQNALRHQGGAPIPNDKVSYRAIFDTKGRIMVLISHNNDLADGWERCKEDVWYTKEYSEKLAFPMGINIVTYALLTHHSK